MEKLLIFSLIALAIFSGRIVLMTFEYESKFETCKADLEIKSSALRVYKDWMELSIRHDSKSVKPSP